MSVREYRIIVDTSEQKPLVFPEFMVMLKPSEHAHALSRKAGTHTVRLTTVRRSLATGDYQLDVPDPVAVVERKGSLREIAQNLFVPERRRQFTNELDRLVTHYRVPVILVATSAESMTDPLYVHAADELVRVTNKWGVRLVYALGDGAAARRATAELVARLLINAQIRPPAFGAPIMTGATTSDDTPT